MNNEPEKNQDNAESSDYETLLEMGVIDEMPEEVTLNSSDEISDIL